MVKYATALRLGTAEAEQVLRRFTRGGPTHPTYAALEELAPVPRQMPPPGQPRSCDEGLADLTDPCMSGAAWRARDGVGSG